MYRFTRALIIVICGCLLLLCTTSSAMIRLDDTNVQANPTNRTTLSAPVPTTHTTTSLVTTCLDTTTANTTTKSTATTEAITQTTTIATTRPPITLTNPKSHRIKVPLIAQKPDYPAGCESVSAVMLLNYWGESVTVDEFIDNHLPISWRFYRKDGKLFGPNPAEYYIGNPRDEGGWGCFAPAIKTAIDDYYGKEGRVKEVGGTSLEDLCDRYIENDHPVLVWVTIAMIDTYEGKEWHFEDGTKFAWPVNEHCMVLVGYDQKYYYFNDPYTGTLKQYPHNLCETRYEQLGKQALVITE